MEESVVAGRKRVSAESAHTAAPVREKGSDNDSDDGTEYVVAEIVDKRTRFIRQTETDEFLVKWSGFSRDENTWEPLGHLRNAMDKVQDFENVAMLVRSQWAELHDLSETSLCAMAAALGERPDDLVSLFSPTLQHLTVVFHVGNL